MSGFCHSPQDVSCGEWPFFHGLRGHRPDLGCRTARFLHTCLAWPVGRVTLAAVPTSHPSGASMFKRALAAVATAGLFVALTPGVSSATVTSVPIPGTPSFDGSVDAVVHDGSTVYVSGEFTHVTDNARTVTRHGVAAFDADTGLVKAWR